MKILRAGDYRRMPWKNGKGETVEIAVFPPDASISDFDWRISMATVSEDGPFSVFDGIDRTLSILSGEGLELTIDGREAVVLRQETAPLPFPADAATSARLIRDTVTDLNVMTRRGRFFHQVTRRDLPHHLTLAGSPTLVLSLGDLALTFAGAKHDLGRFDCAYFPEATEEMPLLSGTAACIVIEFTEQ